MKERQGIGFFERYLTLWVTLCILAGIAVGQWLPAVPEALGKLEYANVSVPVAILIWLMIYPMMLKVDFQSVKNVGRRPKGILITCATNWLIKPFTMFGIAWLFFFVLFRSFIPEPLAGQYLAGAVLLGAAPCTAMVFVWSHLTRGDAAYTLVQVAVNDLIILVAFAPIVALLLGVGGVSIPWDTLLLSVVTFVVIPLAAGVLTRLRVVRRKGADHFNNVFVKKIRQPDRGRTAADARDPLFVPGRNDPRQSAAYPADRRAARPANRADLLRGLRLGAVVAAAARHRRSRRNDRSQQLFRTGRCRRNLAVRLTVRRGDGHGRRRAGRSPRNADARADRE